jgi:UPF0755 protein
MKILIAFLLVLIICCASGFFYLQNQWITPNSTEEDIQLIEIPKGSGAAHIANLLSKNHLIKKNLYFRLYLKANNLESKLQSGVYEIPKNATIVEISQIFVSGKTAVRKITIPEGRATWEIFSILKATYPELDSLKWESLVHDRKFVDSFDLNAPSLEGYLLADTYQFPLKISESEALSQMVNTTLGFINSLTPKSEVLDKYGWHGVLTLASVVEEETSLASERGRIAGVFYNRLKLGMSLGADPTVRFIFRSLTGPIYKSQLESDSPYNTRKFTGLPPGPISNPGREAILAALNPSPTRDLYFVAKDDGSKEHFFATNLVDHNRYKELAAKTRGD